MYCFNSNGKRYPLEYFFNKKNFNSSITIMQYKKSLCIMYTIDQDYWLEIIFSRHFSPKNLHKIKFVNQQLKEKSERYPIMIYIYNLSYSTFNADLINKILNGVRCNLEINLNNSSLKLFPQTASIRTVEIFSFHVSGEYLLDQIEKLINSGFREILVATSEENIEKIRAYFSETSFTIRDIESLAIKIER